MSIFLIPFGLSATTTLDKDSYALTSTASATFTCAGNEKNQDYTAFWTNSSGFEIPGANDTGNTGDCTTFLENFIINSSYIAAYGIGLNVSLIGQNLESGDGASVAAASANDLIISSITHQGTFLGLSSSIDSNVDDENGIAISGGLCDANVEDPSNDQVLHTVRSTMIDGNLDFIWFLEHDRFKENKDYVAKISCFCGSQGSIFECINGNGANVNGSIGSSDVQFRTSTWLTFNEDPFPTTLDNGTKEARQSLFAGYDDIHWLRNVSNNNPDGEPLEVRTRTILVKNDTKQIFGEVNEGISHGDLDGFPTLNSTSFRNHEITRLADTGLYFIRIIYDVIYKNQFQVAQYIKATDEFNITSLQDTFQISDTKVRDFFGADVRLNSSILGRTSAPPADNTTSWTVLSEAFKFDFCLVANNTRDEDLHVYFDELTLENTVLNTSFEIINNQILGNGKVDILEESTTGTTFCITERLPY